MERGAWGVFVWTGTGRYPLSAAVSTHRTEANARTAAVRAGDAYVWRFVAELGV